jgi:hypothetical protein
MSALSIQRFDPVRLTVARPEFDLPVGAEGVVQRIHNDDYEIEFALDGGDRFVRATLSTDQLEVDQVRLDARQSTLQRPLRTRKPAGILKVFWPAFLGWGALALFLLMHRIPWISEEFYPELVFGVGSAIPSLSS